MRGAASIIPAAGRLWIIAPVMLALAGFPANASAKVRLLVITSSNLKIFVEVTQTLPKQFDAVYQTVPLTQAEPWLKKGGYDGVVALGQAAAEKALMLERYRPVFFAGAVSTKSPLFKKDNAIGVDIDPSPALHITRLKKTLPDTRRLGVMGDFKNSVDLAKDLKTAAQAGSLALETCQINEPRDLALCTQTLLVEKRVDVILTLPVAKVYTPQGVQNLARNATAQKVALIATGRYFADKYQFLYALSPDAQGTAMDLADLLRDKFVLRKSLPNLNAPKFLIQVLNGKVMKLLGVAKPPPNHVRVNVTP